MSKILIVDDNPTVRETLASQLEGPGYELEFAADGLEGLAKVEQAQPDLILLDVMMPGLDGFEICRRLKEGQQRHIPVILVTALDSKADLAYGLEAGADDFLAKPVNRLELRARVHSMLRIKSQYDALQQQQRELETALHLNKKYAQTFAQHLEALELLHDTGLRLMDNLDTDAVLDLISQTALELIPEAAGCAIHFLAEEEGELLPVVFARGENSKMVYPAIGIEKIVQQAIKTGQANHISDQNALSPHLRSELPEMRSLLVAPLLGEAQALGALTVYSPEVNAFATSHQHILSILSKQAAVAITTARFFKERALAKEREKQVIRQMFQRYVSPAVVERLVAGQESLALGGRRQEVTILFADIRGFTRFSEPLLPEAVVDALNQYLALGVRAVLAEEGTLDKFMGDALMALFNAPLAQPDHTLRAVRAAAAMQQAIAGYNAGGTAQPLSFGIGLHVGQAVVGNIGTEQQMNYTAIGDAVNLAKRLQEQAEGGQIILSQAVLEQVKEMVVVEALGAAPVKGREAATQLYILKEFRESPRKL